jgi:hypothetical protein
MMEKEDQKCLLVIGGIEIFLPLNPVEATMHIADAATVEEG